jgi:DNA-binding NarL/FixJ family response regulator
MKSEMELTSKELEVLSFVCKGYSNREIAKAVSVSLSTVKFHIHNLLQKTNSKNRTQLAMFVSQYALLEKSKAEGL